MIRRSPSFSFRDIEGDSYRSSVKLKTGNDTTTRTFANRQWSWKPLGWICRLPLKPPLPRSAAITRNNRATVVRPHHAKNFEAGPPHRDFVRWSRLVFNSHAIVGIVAKRYQLQGKIARSQRLLNLFWFHHLVT